MDKPRTLIELLSSAANAIDGDDIDLEKLERLREINQSWIQTDEERDAVDRLLGNMAAMAEELLDRR